MAEQSINIDALQDVVNRLNRAIGDMPEAAGHLANYLNDVGLSSDRLPDWLYDGWHVERLRELARECQQRLDLAREIADSRPGESLYKVTFDDTVFLSDDDARRAAVLIQQCLDANTLGGTGDGTIPPELLDLLDANSGDPGFALALQARLNAGQLAQLLNGLNTRRNQLDVNIGLGAAEPADLETFDADYARLLDGLGATLSLAARTVPPDQLGVVTAQWRTAIQNSAAVPSAALLSMVIARGSWPASFLSGVADTILYDTRPDAAAWQIPGGVPVVDPRFNEDLGCKPEVVDPMAGVFQSAADYNPAWMLSYFQGNGTTPVDLPGYDYPDGQHADAGTAQIDSRLEYLMLEYGFDQASGSWFGQAAATAVAWGLQQSAQAEPDDGRHRPADAYAEGAVERFAADVANAAEHFARQQVVYDHLSWWDKYKHEFLQGLGIVIMVASLAATAGAAAPVVIAALSTVDTAIALTDAAAYLNEGEIVQGLFGLALTVIPVTIGGVTRWVRLKPDEIQALRNGDNITRDGVTVTKNDLKAAEEIAARIGYKTTAPKIKLTEPTGPKGGVPTGRPTKIPPKADSSTVRSLTRENESAQTLADAGFDIEQNPKVPGPKKPDYLLEGEIADCYAPSTDNLKNIASYIEGKAKGGQASRVVLNLDDTTVTAEQVAAELKIKERPGLVEVIAIKAGQIVRIWP
ncbi:MAG: hypothetical protein LBK42_03370 [Propionibacteriaceae bacterium]|nr:hypothetical protein [Propionibacteriaceae bacterium]